jgi:hypothetical protein
MVMMVLYSAAAACGGDAFAPSGPSVPVSVAAPTVASVRISWAGNPVAQNELVFVTTEVKDAGGKAIPGKQLAWTSSNAGVVSVVSAALIRGASRSGTATITAQADGKSDSVAVTTYWAYALSNPRSAVSASSFAVTDARGRTIPIIVQWPTTASGPLPVVLDVFPLPNGEKTDEDLGSWVASAGFVVVHIGTAPYNQSELCAFYNVPDCGSMIWPGRISTVRDASSVLDNVGTIARQFHIDIDAARAGVMGGSSGGAVTMDLAGATVDLSPQVGNVSLADGRFMAFLGNSAPALFTDNGSRSGFIPDSWSRIRKPTMQQVVSLDNDAAGRSGIFDVMPAGDKYLTYYNTPAVDSYAPDSVSAFGPIIASTATAFFDTYLKGSAEAKSWLVGDQASRGSKGAVSITRK